jgi:hypothetical protein
MARRQARGGPAIDSAAGAAIQSLVEAKAAGCVWPMGDPRSPDYRICDAAPLAGRQYCAEHLKKAGMKPVAKVVETSGRMPAPYLDREAG